MRIKDLTGKRVGRLVVLRQDGHIGKYIAWVARCDCGVEKRFRSQAFIKKPATGSCGCLWREWATKRHDDSVKRIAEARANYVKRVSKARTVQIDADIENLPVSRQRKLQLQYQRNGMCVSCGHPRVEGSASYCEKHRRPLNGTMKATACSKCGVPCRSQSAAKRHCPANPPGRPRKYHLSAIVTLLPAYSI